MGVKYKCKECGKCFAWLEDFLNHVKEEHPGKQPLQHAIMWRGRSLFEIKRTLLKEK